MTRLQPSLSDVPDEIVLAVAEYLDIPSIFSFIRCSHRFLGVLLVALYQKDAMTCSRPFGPPDLMCRFEEDSEQYAIHWTCWRSFENALEAALHAAAIAPWYFNARDKYDRTPLSVAAMRGDAALVQCLLNAVGVDAQARDFRGATPLSHASWNGHERVVEILLAHASSSFSTTPQDAGDVYGMTPLSYASSNGHDRIVRMLLQAGEDRYVIDEDKHTPLFYAVQGGHESTTRVLLEHGCCDIEYLDQEGRTPLSHAAWGGHEGIVRILLETDQVDPESKDAWGMTPIMHAAAQGHVIVCKLLNEVRK